MSRIYAGMTIRTSYNTGPYTVVSFVEGCDCPSFIDSLNLSTEAPKSKSHYHLTCTKTGEKSLFYLNGYDENLNSIWGSDGLIVPHEETTILVLSCTKGLII